MKIVNGGGIGGFYFKASESGIPANIRAILDKKAEARSEAEAKTLREYALQQNGPPILMALREKMGKLEKERAACR